MEPKVLSGDAPQKVARSRRLPWLPGIVLALVILIALLAMGSAVSAQSGPEGVLATPWAENFCYSGMQCFMGDFNGDGRDDIIQFNHAVNPAGAVYVRLSNGSSFDPLQGWNSNSFCEQNSDICKVGDFNKDGKDDVVRFRRSTGEVSVALSLGNSFGNSAIWKTGFCIGSEICDVGDYNGDGKADISTFTRSLYADQGLVYVALSNGVNGFGGSSKWVSFFCVQQEMCGSGDFNGDGKDDVIVFSKNYGPVYVATSTGTSFVKAPNNTPWRDFFCPGQEVCGVGDFNGDGKDDISTYLRNLYAGNEGWVYVALSNGSSFPSSSVWDNLFCIGNQTCGSGNYIDTVDQTTYSQVSRTGDFNGDSRDDVVAFLRSTELNTKPGWVYVKLSNGSQFVDSISIRSAWVLSIIIKLVP